MPPKFLSGARCTALAGESAAWIYSASALDNHDICRVLFKVYREGDGGNDNAV